VHEEPKYQYVNQVGYISLFPFLVQIVDPNSPKLGKILRDISNPDIFWTPYGLRSLSKSASIYMKKNTEHDAPYWRGPIWININYLAVRALYNYAQLQGPYQKIAQDTYQKLRQVLVENIFKQFVKTGYIWEQYNDKNGQGQGCRPFTGWSALVVLMMGEKY
jgi:mannosyl-oligosaccharide glucosidase